MHADPDISPSSRRDWFFGLLLVLAVIVVYLPVWRAGFIWDDAAHVTSNPVIVGPQGLKEIWTTSAARICPLVLTTFWVEHALWGLNPLPYHLVNVLMHAGSALLLWRVLLRLGAGKSAARLGAGLWAVHPVLVESVAWVTELKNTQSCLFYLLSIRFFLKWLEKDQAHRRRNYSLALFFGALAMASKSSTVVLPLVLGLCAWWRDGKWKARNLLVLTPYVLLSLAASVLSVWTQHLEGGDSPDWARSGPERLVVAGKVVWFYLGKLLWPHPLIFIYPKWQLDAGQVVSWLPTLMVVVVLGLLWWNRRGQLRPVFFAFASFLVALLPVLGLVDHSFLGYSFVADHFQYLASIGPLALAAVGIVKLVDGAKTPWRMAVTGAGLLLISGALSWSQAHIYRDPETLWLDTLKKNPTCEMACVNLGSISLRNGNMEEAIFYFERTLRIKPDSVAARNNLAWIFATAPQASLRNGIRAVELAHEANQLSHEKNPMVWRSLAAAYAEAGRFAEARQAAQKGIDAAEAAGKSNLVEQISGDLNLYTADRPIVPRP